MQVAILAVLVFIAVILAPWLLGLLAVAVTLYGIWLVLLGCALVVAGLSAVAYVFWSGADSDRKSCPACQANLHESVHICPSCGALI